MRKILLVIALLISTMGLKAQNELTAPTNLTAKTSSHSSILLSWDVVNDSVSYNIYIGDSLVKKTSYTACIIENLEPLTEYCFTVSTAYDDQESAKSNEACATTKEEVVCNTPENVKVNIVLNDPSYGKKYKVVLTWDAVDNAELYAVYYYDKDYDGMWLGNVDTNEFIMGSDVGVEEGAKVFYLAVKTICDSENSIQSPNSEEVEVVLSENNEDIDDATAVKAPQNLTAAVKGSTSIELKWDAADNAKSYFVYRNGNEIANITETTYVDENLTPDTEYCYTVSTMGDTEESEESEEVCAKTEGESIVENTAAFNICPNPVENEISISAEAMIEEVTIYDVYGRQQVNVTPSHQDEVRVDVNDLNSGVYFVKVRTENGEAVRRILKF